MRRIGQFSNMVYHGEHADGYAVELWRDGGSVAGLFLAAAGLAGNTPAGLLENIKFDARTGALSFTARLSIGTAFAASSASGKGEPTRDQFEFNGNLKAKMLTGTLRHTDARQPAAPAARKRVQLRLRSGALSIRASNFAEWRHQIEDILKFRGPAW